MGNQTSRSSSNNRTSATIKDDPCLDNIRQWHTNNPDEPYKRQYPLPAIANDHNRIKPRKQSSPAAVISSINGARKPFSRFFPRSSHRNNSCFDNTSLSKSSVVNKPALANNTTAATTATTTTTITTTSNTTHSNNITPNTTISDTNHSSSSVSAATSSCSFNSTQPRYVHPLSPPSIHNEPCHQMLPYENESFSRPSMESSRRFNTRDSMSTNQLKLLLLQQQQQQQCTYRLFGNRKYHHVDGSTYLLPCDDEEVDRLHLQHFMIRFAIQGNYLAPVSDVLRKGGRVLDIGCGPGSWSMEIAGEYPKSTVIGVDITPNYPREIKPANCAFYQCNILTTLPFEDGTFDYIFMRFMGQGVGSDEWSPLLKELLRVLKPNGWIEWIEADIEIHRPGPVTYEFNQKLISLMMENNQDAHIGSNLKSRLQEMDELTNISTTFVSCPGGQWAGKLGQLTMQSWKAYYQALRPLMCQYWDIPPSEYNEKLKECWREADEYKTFENVHFSYAQKQAAPPSMKVGHSAPSSIKGGARN
ncbi:hypothetical protein PS15m_012066 [Mucor circinelloides]